MNFKKIIVFTSIALFNQALATPFEMLGLVNYNLPSFNPNPANYLSSSGGIGYEFFGRLELGPGWLESGFVYAPFSVTTTQSLQTVKISGSYWEVPLLYRYEFFAPYFSLGAGFDYAIEGGTQWTVGGTPINVVTGYNGNFGADLSLQAKQDVGENVSIVLDLRYRASLSESLNLSGVSSKTHFTSIGLGIVKHLED